MRYLPLILQWERTHDPQLLPLLEEKAKELPRKTILEDAILYDEPILLEWTDLPSDIFDVREERQSEAAEYLADALYQGANKVALTLAEFYGIEVLAEAARYLNRMRKSRGPPQLAAWQLLVESPFLQEELHYRSKVNGPDYLLDFTLGQPVKDIEQLIDSVQFVTPQVLDKLPPSIRRKYSHLQTL